MRAQGSMRSELGGPRRHVDEESGVRRVAERSHHARDVLERRLFEPPLRNRPRRFPLEIQNDEVSLAPENLAEMVIAVHANLRGHEFEVCRPIEFARGASRAIAAAGEPNSSASAGRFE